MTQSTQGIILPQAITVQSEPTRLNRHEARMAYLFITPAMALFMIFVLLPAVIALILSFSNYDVLSPIKWVGWLNYERLLKDKLYFQALGNVVTYTVMYVPLLLNTLHIKHTSCGAVRSLRTLPNAAHSRSSHRREQQRDYPVSRSVRLNPVHDRANHE